MTSFEKASRLYNSALSKKAVDPVTFDLKEISDVTDVFIIASGTSTRHVQSIASAVEAALRDAGEKNYHIEGFENAYWVLIDAGDVVVHVFSEEARIYYDLERHWLDATRIEFEPPAVAEAT